ncbi:MAG TPA: ATP-binding protein, partial [Candidatus Berkiella sp.]|nr:ATP-binding protein [Candidatus Berkiella sp.]
GVIGFINLLMPTKLDHRQNDYLSTIHQSAVSLLSIINDILDFSKIEAGKLTLDQLAMDLRECVEEALTLMAPNAHEKGLELVPMIYSDVPEKIIGDPLRLKQIITNLVNNAIKFTDHGSVVVRIMLEKEESDHIILCVSITDSGIGLSTDEQKTIFQPFTQADSTTTRRFGGTGLGLVISKRLVQQMGGDIGVESEHSKGSTFWFTFVAKKLNEASEFKHHPELAQSQILVYEAHPTARLSLNHLLTSWGIDVVEIDDPAYIQDALASAKFENHPFNMILIGVNQPDPNSGFIEDLIKLATIEFNCRVGVLANTTDQSIYDDIHHSGAAVCLAKPVRRKKLHDALVDILIPEDENTKALRSEKNQNEDVFDMIQANAIKVLAVDDYPSNLKLVAALLENLGIAVDCANRGSEALALLE